MALLSFFRSRKRPDLHPAVRAILEQAIARRSVMLVEFTGRDLAGGRFSGPCEELDEQCMRIDVAVHKELPEWQGEPVQVTFSVVSKGVSAYYQFTSVLRGFCRGAGGFAMLLETPAEIVSSQKRSFVRLAPRREDVFGIDVWMLSPMQARPDAPASLGLAPFSCRPEHSEQVTLVNVSAAGMCLKLRHPPEGYPTMPQFGDRLLCLLMLRAREEAQALSFWLDCTVANHAEKKKEPCRVLGLQFAAWAAPSHDKGAVNWFAVGRGGGIGSLGAWVLRQQLVQLG